MTGRDRTPSDRTPMPRWVKTSIAIGVAVAVLLVVALLTGHGPSRHNSGHPLPAGAPVQPE